MTMTSRSRNPQLLSPAPNPLSQDRTLGLVMSVSSSTSCNNETMVAERKFPHSSSTRRRRRRITSILAKTIPKMPLSSDVLTLDVGGMARIRVRRHILTQYPDSMLAVRFSGRWERDNDDDNDNNETFFIDFSPVIFLPLIDYLRAK